MTDTTFAPGTVVTNRGRLWRVDAQVERLPNQLSL